MITIIIVVVIVIVIILTFRSIDFLTSKMWLD